MNTKKRMKHVSWILFCFFFLFQYLTFGLEDKASDVFSRFISFHNLDDRDFNESDWKNESGDEAQRLLSHLESIGISPESIFNLIQSPDYLQVQQDINSSFFEISETERASLTKETLKEASAADTFSNFANDLLVRHNIDEETVMTEEWVENIIDHTASWTAIEARKFLNFLDSKEIESGSILRLLQSTDYLQVLRAGQTRIFFTFQKETEVIPLTSPPVTPESETRRLSEEISGIARISETGSEVFVRYVEGVSGEAESSWIDSINNKAKNWSVADAALLLNFLENERGISPFKILEMFKSVSFFQTNYIIFKGRIEVYRKYLREDQLRERLEKSFSSFRYGRPKNIENMLLFLEDRIGREDTQKILNNNIVAVAQASGRRLFNETIAFLENYLGEGDREKGRDKLNTMMRNGGLAGIVNFKVTKNKNGDYENERINFLSDRGLEQKEIIKLLENNPVAFSTGGLATDKIAFLENYLGEGDREKGRDKLNTTMRSGGLQGIALFKVTKNKNGDDENDRINFLSKRGLTQEEIIKLLENNPLAFSQGDLATDKIAFLERYLGEGDREKGRDKLNAMMKSGGLQGITQFKVTKSKDGDDENDRINFLSDRGLEQEEIIKLLENNPRAFSTGDLATDKIAFLERYLGEGDREKGRDKLNIMIKSGGLQGIALFKVTKNKDGGYENDRINFLSDRGLEQEEIIKLLENNPLAFSEGGLATDKIAFLENYLGEGDREKGRVKLNTMMRSGGLVGIALFKVTKNKDGDDENERINFLSTKRGLKPEEIIKLLENNPLAFSKGDLATDKIAFLENYLGEGDREKGRAKLNAMMRSGGLVGIAKFKVIKNKNGDYENDRINFLSKRGLEPEEIIKLLENNPLAFSTGDLAIDKIAFLERYLGEGDREKGRDKLNAMMRSGGLQGIALFKVTKNKDGGYENDRINFLSTKRGLKPEEIIKLLENNPLAFSQGDLATDKIAFLERYLGEGDREKGRDKLNAMMRSRGLEGIARFKVTKNKDGDYENDRINFLSDRGLEPEEIIKLLENNPLAFSKGDLATDKIAFLESYLGEGDREKGRGKLNAMIRSGGLAGIVKFKVIKSKDGSYENDRINFLSKRGLEPEEIIKLLENNPSAFSKGDLATDKIAFLERYLGEGDREKGRDKLNTMMRSGGLQGIAQFKVTKNKNGDYENDKINFLEWMDYKPDQIRRLMENHLLELFSGDLTEEESKAYLEELEEKGEIPECVKPLT